MTATPVGMRRSPPPMAETSSCRSSRRVGPRQAASPLCMLRSPLAAWVGRCTTQPGSESPDLDLNRSLWTQVNADFTDADADRAWAASEITWGLFRLPERQLGALGDVAGMDVIEL